MQIMQLRQEAPAPPAPSDVDESAKQLERPAHHQQHHDAEGKRDLWGHEVYTQSDACISHINSYYAQVLSYGSDQKVIRKAVEADGGCALALALSAAHAYTHLASSTPAPSQLLAAARARLGTATLYEKMVVNAVAALVEGKGDAALSAYCEILEHFPKDLVSLKRAQVLCFYMGRPDDSLKFALRVLPANQEAVYMYGMLAFSLLETHRIDEAEVAARKALAIEKNDPWAQHALCHVLHFRCLFQEATLFMENNSHTWDKCCSFMYSHNWWHLALIYMEWGCEHALDRVLEIYDHYIWPPQHHDLGASVQVSLNALGLLLRLELRGFGDRVRTRLLEVTQHLCDRDQSWMHKEWLLDLLAVWALAYVDESSKAETLLKQMRTRFRALDRQQQENLNMLLMVAECLHAYGKGDYREAFKVLASAFRTCELKAIGASDEQLDVFEEVWCIVSIRSGNHHQASDVLKRRISEMNRSPFAWSVMEEYYVNAGSSENAIHAAINASRLKESYLRTISNQP